MQEMLPPRQKWLIVGVLVMLTIAAWMLTIYQSRMHAGLDGMDMSMPAPHQTSPMAAPGQGHGGMMMPGMPMDSAAQPKASTTIAFEAMLFLAMWIAMMIAMMFPSVYPMVLLFAACLGGRQAGLARRRCRPGFSSLAIWRFGR